MSITGILAAIANFTPGAIAGHFASKGLEAYGKPEEDLKDELQDVIQETVVEYADRFPQESGRDLPFYYSVKIVDELLKYRVMKPEEYNPQNLMMAIRQESKVMPPTAKNLEDFFSLFLEKVNTSPDLRKLEIQQDFKQEIFNVARSIEGLKDQIDALAASYTGDLEIQWKNRLDTYVTTFQAFKPRTALSLLESLETSFETSDRRPGAKFMAFLYHQKALCLAYLDRSQEGYALHIKAWALDSSRLRVGQSAAISYYHMGNEAEALKICRELLAKDPFNPVGWALPLLCSPPEQFLEELSKVPLYVKNDISFVRVLYNQAIFKKDQFSVLLRNTGLLPSCLDYQEKEVTIDNYSEAVFWINICSADIFGDFYIDFKKVNQGQRDKIAVLNTLLGRFLEKVRDSEFADPFNNLEFYYAFSSFSLHQDERFALEMEHFYYKLEGSDYTRMLHCANALQLAGHPEKAILVMECESSHRTESLLLLLYCYLQVGNMDMYPQIAKRYFLSMPVFENYWMVMTLNLMVEIKLHGKISEFVLADFLPERQYKTLEDERLIGAVARLVFEKADEHDILFLNVLCRQSENQMMNDVIGSAFFCAEMYEEALAVLAMNLDGKAAGRELFQYIHAQHKIGKDYRDLLSRLEHWRENLEFNPGFLRLEANLHNELMNWQEVIDITAYYLKEIPEDEWMLLLHVHSLDKVNSEDSRAKIALLSPMLRDFEFSVSSYIESIAHILMSQGQVMDAFELIYRYAIDEHQVDLRAAYFNMVLRLPDAKKLPGPLEEFTEALVGRFVKYEIDGNAHFVELDEKAKVHSLHSQLFGKKAGESFTIKRGMLNIEDTVKILHVMNKYRCLHLQIMHQSEVDPHAGLGFYSFKTDPDNPGGLIEMMQNMFSGRGEIIEHTNKAKFDEYYQLTSSFSDIVMSEYKNDFINGYYNLIEYHRGIATIQQLLYPEKTFVPEHQFLIDFSSLILFYQLSMNGTVFQDKFLVSKYLVEGLRGSLRRMQFSFDRSLSAPVEFGQKVASEHSFDFRLDSPTYISGMLGWIEENCEVLISDQMIEVKKGSDYLPGEVPILDMAISNTLILLDNPNRKLITDDTVYLKYSLLPAVSLRSSELFLKNRLPDDDPALNEFVKNRYVRYLPSVKQLNDEFYKFIAGKPANYTLLLGNLRLIYSGSNLFSAFGHIREIALCNVISLEQMESYVANIFVNLLQETSTDVTEAVRIRVFHEFKLLGTKHDLILNAFYNAIDILKNS